jgi:hypothetical protein
MPSTPVTSSPVLVSRAQANAPDARVISEYIKILREIHAPQELISVAERVAERTARGDLK